MKSPLLTRRDALGVGAGAVAALSLGKPARAAPTKVRFLTSWFAEAEHGGFYQAKATGLYAKAGLDVDIKMGGPQVNGMQLLTGGAADMMMGYDIQVLKGIESGLPITTIATSFQFDLQGIMAHDDVPSLAALKGHKILIGATSHLTFWPWLKQKYGFTDAMAGVDTFNLQPFLVDKTVAMQGYPSSEPYEAEQAGQKVKFFLLADDGYPPYSSTVVTTDAYMRSNPEVCQAFVRASMEGWKSYFQDPAPGNKLIQADNPKETDGQIAFAIGKMKEMHVLDRGDGATMGIGVMTEARWQQTRDFMVNDGLLKADVPWQKAFTTRFTDGLKIFV